MIPIATLPPLPPPARIVLIQHNDGGKVLDFGRRVQAYIDRKSLVRVEGDCASACTMVAAVPNDRLCVGPTASFGFHQSYTPADRGMLTGSDVDNRSDAGTAFMMAFYPQRLKDWIASKGGLTSQMLVLRGAELAKLFRACR